MKSNSIALDLDGSDVRITINLGHESNRDAAHTFDNVSREFHTCGAVVLHFGDLQFIVDVTPRPDQAQRSGHVASDPC